MREAKGVPEDDIGVCNVLGWVGCDPRWQTLRRFSGRLRHVAASRMDLRVVVYMQWSVETSSILDREHSHFVTWTAWRAKPARFQTRPPSFGRSGGTSRLTSLYVAGFLLYGLILSRYVSPMARKVFK